MEDDKLNIIQSCLYSMFPLYGIITVSRIQSFLCWHFPLYIPERICRLRNKNDIFSIYNNKIKMYLPCKHDIIQTEILVKRQFYESGDLEKIHGYITPESIVLDIGANIGNHTVYFGSVLKARKVYSFEPQTKIASICKMNIDINGLENTVTLFECGLGETNSSARIIVDGSAVNNSGGTALEECLTGTIPIKKLDCIDIPEKIDFIKIDVEGMEKSVLLGAKNTILKDKPVIWIEIFGGNYPKVSEILYDFGYIRRMELSKDNYLFVPGAAT